MRKTIGVGFFLAIVVGAAVVAFVAGPRPAASAENPCAANPTSTAPSGSRWFYRADRSSGRKCWFLAPQNAFPRTAGRQKKSSLSVSTTSVSAPRTAIPTAAIPLPLERPNSGKSPGLEAAKTPLRLMSDPIYASAGILAQDQEAPSDVPVLATANEPENTLVLEPAGDAQPDARTVAGPPISATDVRALEEPGPARAGDPLLLIMAISTVIGVALVVFALLPAFVARRARHHNRGVTQVPAAIPKNRGDGEARTSTQRLVEHGPKPRSNSKRLMPDGASSPPTWLLHRAPR